MSDLFSAAAKPLYLPHEESLESRSIRKGRQTSHLKVQLPGRPESPSSSSDVDMSSSPINDSFLEMDSKEKDTLDAFPAPNVNATTPPPLAPSQGRLRRNSLGRQSLVAINNVARCASSESSLDDDIRCAVNRAVDQGSSNLDLAHRGIEQLPEVIGDLRYCTSLKTQSGPRDFRKSQSDPSISFRSSHSSQLNLQLARNFLTSSSFPCSFWDLQNLTVLSLRNNELTELPEGIGMLVNLKNLNISSNRLTCLPSSILNLELDQLLCQPNPFMLPPADAKLHPASQRLLGPATTHNKVPSLTESCHRLLLSLATAPAVNAMLVRHLQQHPHLAAPLALSHENSSQRHRKCARPEHASTKPAFVCPAVERYEWRKSIAGCVVGTPEVPIHYQGCSFGCLDFLEDALQPIASASTDDDWVL